MKSFVVVLLGVLLAVTTECSPARQAHQTHLHDFHNHCFPNRHHCLKGHHHQCCSGYCGMIHVGPGSISAINQMTHGRCMARTHTDKDHHPKTHQQTAWEAISG